LWLGCGLPFTSVEQRCQCLEHVQGELLFYHFHCSNWHPSDLGMLDQRDTFLSMSRGSASNGGGEAEHSRHLPWAHAQRQRAQQGYLSDPQRYHTGLIFVHAELLLTPV